MRLKCEFVDRCPGNMEGCRAGLLPTPSEGLFMFPSFLHCETSSPFPLFRPRGSFSIQSFSWEKICFQSFQPSVNVSHMLLTSKGASHLNTYLYLGHQSIRQTFIEHLLCARLSAKHWAHKHKERNRQETTRTYVNIYSINANSVNPKCLN